MLFNKEETLQNREEIIESIISGKIFIYPTDTIYGIGCNALDSGAVAKIRQIKQRDSKPFSVIVPSEKWIRDNCNIGDSVEGHLGKLPGPYTLFLKLKEESAVASDINPLNNNATVGVRIPAHWFTDLVVEAGIPFVTTSVNLSGEPHMTSLDNLDETIKNSVDFIIYEGPIEGQPSRKIDLTQ